MESFVTELSTSFDVDPAQMAGMTTGLVIEKVESLTGITDSSPLACMACGIAPFQEG